MKKLLIIFLFVSSSFCDIGKLTKIVDGDTVHFGNTICRLAYIDTPESRKNNRLENKLEKCNGVTVESMISAGKESKKYIEESLTIGKSYKYNITSVDVKNNRKVCEIYVNSEMLNLNIVYNGFAVPYNTYIPNNLKDEFSKASKEAKRLKKGLYKTNLAAINCIE